MQIIFYLLFTFLFLSFGAVCQMDTITFQAVEIEAPRIDNNRIGTHAIRFEEDDLISHSGSSLEGLLRDQTNLFISTYSPYSLAGMIGRGTASRHSQVLHNG